MKHIIKHPVRQVLLYAVALQIYNRNKCFEQLWNNKAEVEAQMKGEMLEAPWKASVETL